MVPPYSHGIPRVPRYSGYHAPTLVFEYWTITIYGLPSHAIPLTSVVLKVVRTPRILLSLVWPLPRSLATTSGISVDFFSSPYLDVSVREVPHATLWIHVTFLDSSSRGFPQSEIHGSKLICSSPWLIAACHVLLRLLMPRHSPCALIRLNFRTFVPVLLNCLSFLNK